MTSLLDRIRAWWLRRHLDRRHGFALTLSDAWMATADLDQLVEVHEGDHGDYEGGGGRNKHEHP